MNLFFYQIKQAYLSLKQKPGFVFSVFSTMGITLGALLCVLTLAYVMLFKPLPYPEPEQLVKINYQRFDENAVLQSEEYLYQAALDLYTQYSKRKLTAFSDMVLLSYTAEVFAAEQRQNKVNTTYVTSSLFNFLAAPMALGRGFSEDESLNNHVPGAVLSYSTWQEKFSGSSDVLTQRIVINGISHPVIGVTAKSFIEPQLYQKGRNTQLWLPWDYNSSEFKDNWIFTDNSLALVARVNQQSTNQQATQQLNSLLKDSFTEQQRGHASEHHWRAAVALINFKDALTTNSATTVLLLFCAALGLLLIAIANIANLFLARTIEQQNKMAISAALGAKKSHLQLNVFIETSLLMFLAMLLALVIVLLGFGFIQNYFSLYLARVTELKLSLFTLSSAIFMAMSLAYLFSWLSVRTLNYQRLNNILQASGKGAGVQISKVVRNGLIASQIGIVAILIFSNCILLKVSINQLSKPLGFNAEQVIAMNFSVSALNWQWSDYSAKAFELKEQLLLLPEIDTVSFAPSPIRNKLQLPVSDVVTNTAYSPFLNSVDHQYFELMQQKIYTGRGFTEDDVISQDDVVLVNRSFAKLLADNEQAVLGMKLTIDGTVSSRIIGVVEDIQLPTESQATPRIYLTNYGSATYLLIKLKPQQSLRREQIIMVLSSIDKKLLLSKFEKVSDSLNNVSISHFLTAITAIVLTVLTLFLAAIGLYGILSYSSQIRRFEFGTRMAIGGKGSDIISLVLKDNAGAFFTGIMISIVVLLGAYLGLRDLVMEYLDSKLLPMFIFTVLLILLVSFFACYLPLRQYIKQPVMHSLRGSE